MHPLTGAFFFETASQPGRAQEDSLNSQLEVLIKVQAIDTLLQQSAAVQAKYNQDIAALDQELQKEEAAYAEEKEGLQRLDKEHRSLERALEEAISRRGKAQDKLLAVKTNKEYTAALQEIEGIKQAIRTQEDAILEVMEQTETLKKTLKGTEEVLKKIRAEYSQKKNQLDEDLKIHLEEVEVQKKQRAAQVASLDPRALLDYTKLLEAKNGLAVVAAKNERCLGCNMKIPPQTYNLVITSTDIIHCPSCRRMLYIEPEPENVPPQPAG
jgi:predicted  nucleic acid-binding Zn-ribbon protein